MLIEALVLMVLSAKSIAQDRPYCTENSIKRAQAACNAAYGGGPGSDLTPICRRLDCVLQCLKEAVSDCWKTDQFFNYDLTTTVVRYRAMCEDLEKTKRAQSACNPKSCESKFLTKVYVDRMKELYNKGDFASYKELECSRARDTLNCILTTKVGPDCSSDMEELSKGVETVTYSMSECGIAQDHQFFKTYADKGTPCSNPALNNRCLLTPLAERASKCLEIPGLDTKPATLISTVCSNIECNLKCYLDAVGDCYKEDKMFNMDPKVISVIGRALCKTVKGTNSPLNLCPINNQSCTNEFNSAGIKASAYLMSGNYTEFKTILCSATKEFKTCVDVSVTDTCTDSLAEQARSMYQVGYSYAACGPQDHSYFTKYGGEVQCLTSGYALVMSSFITVGLMTALIILWV